MAKLTELTSQDRLVISALRNRDNVVKLFDELVPRFTDGNLKVNISALETVQGIIPAVGPSFSVVAANVVPVLVNNLANRQAKVRICIDQHISLLFIQIDAFECRSKNSVDPPLTR